MLIVRTRYLILAMCIITQALTSLYKHQHTQSHSPTYPLNSMRSLTAQMKILPLLNKMFENGLSKGLVDAIQACVARLHIPLMLRSIRPLRHPARPSIHRSIYTSTFPSTHPPDNRESPHNAVVCCSHTQSLAPYAFCDFPDTLGAFYIAGSCPEYEVSEANH